MANVNIDMPIFVHPIASMVYAVASNPEPPRWNPGDFFGDTFGKPSGGKGK